MKPQLLASDISWNISMGAGIADGWVSAAEAWSYASATTITVPTNATTKYQAGMRIKLTQTTIKYFIITNVAATVLTVYGGTDYTLANAAISANNYSTVKAPFGFPLDPAKWTVLVTDANRLNKTNCGAGTYYGGANAWTSGSNVSISVPIGVWRLMYYAELYCTQGNASFPDEVVVLSTSNNSATPTQLKGSVFQFAGGYSYGAIAREMLIFPTTATTYYLLAAAPNAGTTEVIAICGDRALTTIQAICAYL